MADKQRARKPYRKILSIFEMQALVGEHRASPIFVTDHRGEQTLEPWLKDLRIGQAQQIAERILGVALDEQVFQDAWRRTQLPISKKPREAAPPNTATFGGYRLRDRSALSRDKKGTSSPPRRYKSKKK
jgi:hypothetical protein